jgi:hypothetical protein
MTGMYDLFDSRAWLAMLLVAATAAAGGCEVEPQARAAVVPRGMAGLDTTSTPIHAIFPAASCRSGYQQAGPRMCVTLMEQGPATWVNASSACRTNRGHVCSYEDLTYLYQNSGLDASYNPLGRWIGNMPSDDQVFCGNAAITVNGDPDIPNFEGTCAKTDMRRFWCCHDDME